MVQTRSGLVCSRKKRVGVGVGVGVGRLPTVDYTGRIRPNGVPLLGRRYIKRYVFHELEYSKR